MSDKYIKKIESVFTPGVMMFGDDVSIVIVSTINKPFWVFGNRGVGDELFFTSDCLVNQLLKRGQFRFRRWSNVNRIVVQERMKHYNLFDFDHLFFKVRSKSNISSGTMRYYVDNIINIL